MLKDRPCCDDPTTFGFAVPPRDARAPDHRGTLPALIATLSLGLSIAIVLTAMTVTARAAATFLIVSRIGF
jgi:hypothetical protein